MKNSVCFLNLHKLLLPLMILLLFSLSGCASAEELNEPTFSMSEEQKKEYEKKIDEILYSLYWRYDSDSLEFFGAKIPENTSDNKAIFSASKDSGFELSGYAGKDAIVATGNLLHFNDEKAGMVHLYFIKKELVGAYYTGTYQNTTASLKTRNLFLSNGKFKKFETNAPQESFSEKSMKFPSSGFISAGTDFLGNPLFLSLENKKAIITSYKGGFSQYRSFSYGEDLMPVSGTFLQSSDGQGGSELALLLSNVSSNISGEGEIIETSSEKIVFFDKNLSRITLEVPLSSEDYTCISADGDSIILANANSIEYYKRAADKFEKYNQVFLKHGLTNFHKTDLDGDGVFEYLITDGMDLYLYKMNEDNLNLVWSTHLGVESLLGGITTGDLNADDVKEIYICDLTGTTIRYTLTPTGLISRNEDILYGDRLYPFDFNRDGKDDFIYSNEIEQKKQSVNIGN